MAKTKSRTRRTFTSEYKLQAVQLITEKGFSYAEAARHTPAAVAGESLRALGIELLFPSADLGVSEAELASGLGVRKALLGDELHRLELVLAREGASGSGLGLGHG